MASITKLMKFCKVENCNKKYRANGYCARHDQQIKNFGKIIRTRFDPNEFMTHKDHVEIVLYNKYGAEKARALIDLDDVEKCKKYKWCVDKDNYVITTFKNKKILKLHNYIVSFKGIDHINRNPLDNRKVNLREATHQENCRNRLRLTNCTSKYRGVYYNKKYNKWCSQLTIDRKTKHIGTFDLEITAAQAYNFMAKELHGEFACLNKV